MIYRDVANKGIELSYETYKSSLAQQPLHQEIIQTVQQYATDVVNFFRDDFISEKVFYVAQDLYFKENAIMSYNSNAGVLATILATYCIKYVLEISSNHTTS